MKHILQATRLTLTTIHALAVALALAVAGAALRGMAQQGKGETVIQKAIEQFFESNRVKTIPVDTPRQVIACGRCPA